jgi:hypothetical protein
VTLLLLLRSAGGVVSAGAGAEAAIGGQPGGRTVAGAAVMGSGARMVRPGAVIGRSFGMVRPGAAVGGMAGRRLAESTIGGAW